MASLIYHAGALGDFITTLPAMSAWRRLHPRQRIVLLGRPELAPLADPATLFDETWDAGAGMFAPLFSTAPGPSPELVPRFSLFTSALLFAPGSSPLKQGQVIVDDRDPRGGERVLPRDPPHAYRRKVFFEGRGRVSEQQRGREQGEALGEQG